MTETTTYFERAAAVFLAHQNTADDGEWTYRAEPVEGNAAKLYRVAIYGQDGEFIGTL